MLQNGTLQIDRRKSESFWSRFVQIAFWLLLGHCIIGLIRISPECCHSAMGSCILWMSSRIIILSFDLHITIGELRCLNQCTLWIRKPQKPLKLLSQLHDVAWFNSLSLKSVWRVISSPSPLESHRGYSLYFVLFMINQIPVFLRCHSNFLKVTTSFGRIV